MAETTVVPTLEELLEKSVATPEFREAALEFSRTHRPGERIAFGGGNPPVKVLRVICGLLEAQPSLAVDRVEVMGSSGCSDYRGRVHVNDREKSFAFVWDCAWKAEQVGWTDFFGNPDQIRAARSYGYQCFQTFEEIAS